MVETKGLIIKETKYGEGNKIYTAVTEKFGKIQISAKGVRSFKSKLSCGAVCFGYSNFQLKEGKSMYSLTGADLLEGFYDLRTDITKLSYASYFSSLVNKVTNENDECVNILRLLLNTLYYITKNDEIKITKPVFELRLLGESGFLFDVSSCNICQSTKNLCSFIPEEGICLCEKCAVNKNITKSALSAIEFIQNSDIKKLFSFNIDEQTEEYITGLAEKLIFLHIGNPGKALLFLKDIL